MFILKVWFITMYTLHYIHFTLYTFQNTIYYAVGHVRNQTGGSPTVWRCLQWCGIWLGLQVKKKHNCDTTAVGICTTYVKTKTKWQCKCVVTTPPEDLITTRSVTQWEKKFSWSQYLHPLYYTKWEKLLGKPAQARKKQLQPANRSHMITHQQTSPILPQTRSRYIPPTPSTQ